MQYKAIMFDVDGTLVPYDYSAVPSDAVTKAIKKAQEKVTVCLVTGRSYSFLKPVLDTLQIHAGLIVLNNGSQVMDLQTTSLLYDSPMDIADANFVKDLLFKEKVTFYVKQQVIGTDYQEKFTEDKIIKKAYMFYTDEEYASEEIERILKQISERPNIKAQKSHHKSDKFGLSVEHVNATKLHGIEAIMKQLNFKKDEIIGVGDGYNDFPLLMACGLKVAMGNAIPDLKEIADYVAPSVAEDGVVHIINKFILA